MHRTSGVMERMITTASAIAGIGAVAILVLVVFNASAPWAAPVANALLVATLIAFAALMVYEHGR